MACLAMPSGNTSVHKGSEVSFIYRKSLNIREVMKNPKCGIKMFWEEIGFVRNQHNLGLLHRNNTPSCCLEQPVGALLKVAPDGQHQRLLGQDASYTYTPL